MEKFVIQIGKHLMNLLNVFANKNYDSKHFCLRLFSVKYIYLVVFERKLSARLRVLKVRERA